MNITKQRLLLALLVSYIYTTKQQKQDAPHQEYQDTEFAAEYELVLAQNLGVQLEREKWHITRTQDQKLLSKGI